MKKQRITLLFDPDEDRDIISHLQGSGVSNEGRRLLRLAMLLKRADLVDTLELLERKGIEEREGATGMIAKALNMASMLEDRDDKAVAEAVSHGGLFSEGNR